MVGLEIGDALVAEFGEVGVIADVLLHHRLGLEIAEDTVGLLCLFFFLGTEVEHILHYAVQLDGVVFIEVFVRLGVLGDPCVYIRDLDLLGGVELFLIELAAVVVAVSVLERVLYHALGQRVVGIDLGLGHHVFVELHDGLVVCSEHAQRVLVGSFFLEESKEFLTLLLMPDGLPVD